MPADLPPLDTMVTAVLAGLPAGLALGAFFFGGLWFTVRRIATMAQPAPWFALSLLARLGIVTAGFWLLGRDAPLRLVGALAGFVVMRAIVVRLAGRRAVVSPIVPREAHGGAQP